MAKLSHLSLNHSTVHHLRKKSKSKSSIVIQSDNIEDDHVCWWFRCSFLQCRGSRLTLFSMMTDISRYFRIPKWRKAVQVVRKYSTVSVVPSGSHWVSKHAHLFLLILSELLSQLFSISYLNDSLNDSHCSNWTDFIRYNWLTMKILWTTYMYIVDSHDAVD